MHFFHLDSVKRLFFFGIPVASVEISCCDKTSLVSKKIKQEEACRHSCDHLNFLGIDLNSWRV